VLATEAPGVAVLSEEAGGAGAGTRWAVDPLDGTTNFMRGFPVVGVSVGLLQDGLPEVGVVLAPWLGLEFAAQRGGGATLNGQRLPQLPAVDPRRAVVSTAPPFRRKHRLPYYDQVLRGALERFEDVRRAGAASLDLAWTASATFDGYFELSVGTWDMAGGAALVLEVGGRVSDWSGGPGWLQSGDILAAPPGVHEALLELAGQTPQG
jgi:myo-inositol-1(or 4)-monophosphatase